MNRIDRQARYARNQSMISQAEGQVIREKRVCVIGCGGLGGYVIEMLARLGVGRITVVDGDVFDVTNLNRQLFASEDNIGEKKAMVAQARIGKVNSETEISPVSVFLTAENALDVLEGHDVVIDALDSIPARFLLERSCSTLNIPIVYGAIAGWYGQVAVIFPEDHLLEKIYGLKDVRGKEVELGNPSFTPALIASIQVSETLKLLLNRGEVLKNKLLLIDLLNLDFETLDFT